MDNDQAELDVQESIYRHLHAIAVDKMSGERSDHTLQPTALVHEAWIRLGSDLEVNDRDHFIAMGALAMRRILIDHARSRGRLKRGGGLKREKGTWALEAGISVDLEDSMSLAEAMQRLEERDPRASQIVVLRVLGGLDIETIAQMLEVSSRTVKRDWRFAQAWLLKELNCEGSDAT